jgi:CheY-like chemotaxis protein
MSDKCRVHMHDVDHRFTFRERPRWLQSCAPSMAPAFGPQVSAAAAGSTRKVWLAVPRAGPGQVTILDCGSSRLLDRFRRVTTLLIVDDHAGFRATARALMGAEGFDVIAEAADGESAVAQAKLVDPDVVLLDVELPDMDGFEVAERLAREGLRAAVVLTSSRDSTDFGQMVARSPALGFVPKADLSGDAIRELIA